MLTLYSTKLTPSKNAVVENIGGYLGTCRNLRFPNMGYIKNDLDITVKVNLEQHNLDALGYNYAVIFNDGDVIAYNYFILGVNWKSANTIELVLSMDTLNTFYNDLQWSDRTLISRQHKDRFIRSVDRKILNRKIDKFSEGIDTVRYKTFDSAIYDNEQLGNFYLIYQTRKDLDLEDKNTNNPVDCFLLADSRITVSKPIDTGGRLIIEPKDLAIDQYYIFTDEDNPGGEFFIGNGEVPNKFDATHKAYAFLRRNSDPNRMMWSVFEYRKIPNTGAFEAVGSSPFVFFNGNLRLNHTVKARITSGLILNLDTLRNYPSVGFASGKAPYIATIPFANFNRTDSRLMKIIKLPYAPFKLNYTEEGKLILDRNWEYAEGMLRLKNLDIKMENTLAGAFDISFMKVQIPTATDIHKLHKSPVYESKLFNSNYYEDRLTYDDNSIVNLPELVSAPSEGEIPNTLPIKFYTTNTINSNLMFKLDRSGISYKHVNDADDYMLSARNNEVPIYSNSYLDYVRNGYNYDRATQRSQTAQRWASFGLNVLTAGVTGIISTVTGGVTGALSASAAISSGSSALQGLVSNISAQVQSERDIQQKLDSAKAQATGYRGSNDIDLFEVRTENKVHHFTYQPSAEMAALLFDLFYYCGYADNSQDKPNLNTRYWFNYILCQPVFENEQNLIVNKYIDDIKARFTSGVTIFHDHNLVWDLDQTKENWEVWVG